MEFSHSDRCESNDISYFINMINDTLGFCVSDSVPMFIYYKSKFPHAVNAQKCSCTRLIKLSHNDMTEELLH